MLKFALTTVTCSLLLCSCTENAEKKSGNNTDNVSWSSMGDTIIAKTFDTLRNTLIRETSAHGFAGGIGFCSVNAQPLTAAFATTGTVVKRTSVKLRNPANAPDSIEAAVFALFSQHKDSGLQVKPVLKSTDDGSNHYFKPIIMQAMCLHCHGEKGKNIAQATWDSIQKKYPADAAFNYKEGDLRGLWHITFTKKDK